MARRNSKENEKWIYATVALVVGLVVPANLNPIAILIAKFKNKDADVTNQTQPKTT